MKRILSVLMVIMLMASTLTVVAEETEEKQVDIGSKSAILMEKDTGKIIFEYNADEQLRPASVTKVMTLLLAYEAIADKKVTKEDMVTISDYAASMTGSKIFLEANEQMELSTLMKGVAVASGNDAAVAVGEYIGGSVDGFVELMNAKAKELGMENTHFENPSGLDADGHLTTARDIALMSRELISKYPEVLELSSIYHDTLTHQRKDGEQITDLTNRNKLVKFYEGCNGLKTGWTTKAMYSISATAERSGLGLIAVVMGAQEKKTRTKDVVRLFDFGFGKYQVVQEEDADQLVGEVDINRGVKSKLNCYIKDNFKTLLPKSAGNVEIRKEFVLDEEVKAPVEENQKVGEVKYYMNDEEIGTGDIIVKENVERTSMKKMLRHLFELWS